MTSCCYFPNCNGCPTPFAGAYRNEARSKKCRIPRRPATSSGSVPEPHHFVDSELFLTQESKTFTSWLVPKIIFHLDLSHRRDHHNTWRLFLYNTSTEIVDTVFPQDNHTAIQNHYRTRLLSKSPLWRLLPVTGQLLTIFLCPKGNQK